MPTSLTGPLSGILYPVTTVYTVDAAISVANATALAIDVSSAIKQSDINPITFSGNYDFDLAGQLVCNGYHKRRIKLRSGVATPLFNSWAGIDIQGIDANSSITFTDIEDASVPLDYEATYTVDNLTVNNVLIKNCALGGRSASTGTVTIGALEFTRTGDDGSASSIWSWSAAGTLNITTLYMHDLGTLAATSWTQGTMTITNFIAVNVRTCTLTRTSGTPSLTITKMFTYNATLQFNNWTAGTLDLNGGIIANNAVAVFAACLNILATVDDMDFYQLGARLVTTSGPNGNNCYTRGGNNGTNGIHDEFVDSTVGGTKDGVADINTMNLPSTDSWLNTRATPNYPKTITSVSLASPTNGGFTATFTVNYPGKCWLVLSEADTTVNHYDELASYEIRSPAHYDQYVDFAGSGKTQFTLSARTIAITGLKPGTTYYVYVVVQPFGTNDPAAQYYQSAGNITTLGVAPGVEPVGAGFNRGLALCS